MPSVIPVPQIYDACRFRSRVRNAPMRLVVALFAFLVFSLPSVAAPTPAAPDEDPDNVLIIQLKDGPVVIRMRPDLAPNHVKRIKELVRQGFYGGLVWDRVIPGPVAP